MLVKIKGLVPRIFIESLSITFKSAPTKGAKSILLMTSKSDLVIPGPPLRGILSPSATSITKIVASTSSGLKVAERLSPPLSMNRISNIWETFDYFIYCF